MAPNQHAWRSPALSTTTDDAVRAYRRGIAALVAGSADAQRSLEEAVAADPGFVLAQVGLAAAQFADGRPFRARPEWAEGTSRAERHHTEIVAAVCRGDRHHAADLRREHLIDYPADLLVVWAPILDNRSVR